jgi:hypothetical protein
MVRISLLALFAAICLGLPAEAAEDRAAAALKDHAPSEWDVRVRWRDGQLLATITPQPYQTAFELWYAPAKMIAALKDLCPGADAEIWSLVGSEHDIVLEPSVGAKTVPGTRVSCRKAMLDRS